MRNKEGGYKTPTKENYSLSNIDNASIVHKLNVYQELGRMLALKISYKIIDGRISFRSADSLKEMFFNREERIQILKTLTDAGYLRFENFKGWVVLKPLVVSSTEAGFDE